MVIANNMPYWDGVEQHTYIYACTLNAAYPSRSARRSSIADGALAAALAAMCACEWTDDAIIAMNVQTWIYLPSFVRARECAVCITCMHITYRVPLQRMGIWMHTFEHGHMLNMQYLYHTKTRRLPHQYIHITYTYLNLYIMHQHRLVHAHMHQISHHTLCWGRSKRHGAA